VDYNIKNLEELYRDKDHAHMMLMPHEKEEDFLAFLMQNVQKNCKTMFNTGGEFESFQDAIYNLI